MKKLLLIRHAKATHETGFKDFERPLQESGLHDAAIMASHLKEKGYVPEILVASPALRTLSTAHVFSQHLDLPQAETNMAIYEAGLYTLVKVINELPAGMDFVAFVGHNPGMSELLYYLTGQVHEVPTCTTMVINFDTDDWATITGDCGMLAYYNYPKNGL